MIDALWRCGLQGSPEIDRVVLQIWMGMHIINPRLYQRKRARSPVKQHRPADRHVWGHEVCGKVFFDVIEEFRVTEIAGIGVVPDDWLFAEYIERLEHHLTLLVTVLPPGSKAFPEVDEAF